MPPKKIASSGEFFSRFLLVSYSFPSFPSFPLHFSHFLFISFLFQLAFPFFLFCIFLLQYLIALCVYFLPNFPLSRYSTNSNSNSRYLNLPLAIFLLLLPIVPLTYCIFLFAVCSVYLPAAQFNLNLQLYYSAEFHITAAKLLYFLQNYHFSIILI